MTCYCGVYLGLTPNSGFVPHKFDSVEQVMLYMKSHLEWIKEKSYGLIVFTDETVKKGKHDVPTQLRSWHKNGEDCSGESAARAEIRAAFTSHIISRLPPRPACLHRFSDCPIAGGFLCPYG